MSRLEWVLAAIGSTDTCPCAPCRQRRALAALVRGEQEIPDLYALRAAVIALLKETPYEAVAGEAHAPRDS